MRALSQIAFCSLMLRKSLFSQCLRMGPGPAACAHLTPPPPGSVGEHAANAAILVAKSALSACSGSATAPPQLEPRLQDIAGFQPLSRGRRPDPAQLAATGAGSRE